MYRLTSEEDRSLKMTYLRFALLLMAVVLTAAPLSAQTDEVEYRMDVGAGLGTSYYWGDVNTGMYKNAGFAAALSTRFILNSRMAVKAMLGRNAIKGSTADVKNVYPSDLSGMGASTPLEYSFSGNVTDLSVMYELNFWPYGYERGYLGLSRITPFIQLGLGASYSDVDKTFTANVPLGLGVKYKVGPRLNLALDWTVHFTMSDNIDGLSAPYGVTSSGFKNKDAYFTTLLTLTYDIAPRCITCNKDKR